jgi:hypothetical protein
MFFNGTGVFWVFLCSARCNVVLVVVSKMRSMAVTVVKVVDMAVVPDRGMAAVDAVLVLVPFGLEVPLAGEPAVKSAV